ncbi:MAG: hypothetical protein R3C26_01000 [Calditrichia bacterium]
MVDKIKSTTISETRCQIGERVFFLRIYAATVERNTSETQISMTLNIDGDGKIRLKRRWDF